jgi:hypothetical protein
MDGGDQSFNTKKCDESFLIAQENNICHPIVVF